MDTFTNEVTAVSTEDPGPATSQATVTVVAPDVTVSKTVDPQQILVGEQAVFTITVRNNNGTAAANNLQITDVLDSGLVRLSGDLPSTIATLPANGSQVYTVTVRADEDGVLGNDVTVDWREREPSQLPVASARATVEVLTPDIMLTKTTTDGSLLYTGESGTYTITVENNGAANLTNVTVTDTIPSNMSYVSSSHSGTTGTDANGNTTVTWSAFALAVGEVIERTVTLHADTVCDNCPNVARVTTDQGPEAMDEQDIQILPATGGNIRISENTGALMRVGETVEFTATVENENDITPMTQVSVSIEVSDHFDIIQSSLPTGASVSGETVTFTQIPSLAPGESRQFTITVEAVADGSGTGTAHLQYAEFGQSLSHDAGINILPARQ